ncbi:hypothetical protein EQG49_00225 [Periweissella cryptocerci]|uniref:Uncharacterized protein n=1 Tax=Periweissella cryptocerci TaxID=2506420 RepID=A0A4P6YQT8_9LACO|nr:hypothetical protein [Periweissella cryptocerci]QBO34980.1 hypothetical protein EQG49_00225 [Periweissella cryptocerci]
MQVPKGVVIGITTFVIGMGAITGISLSRYSSVRNDLSQAQTSLQTIRNSKQSDSTEIKKLTSKVEYLQNNSVQNTAAVRVSDDVTSFITTLYNFNTSDRGKRFDEAEKFGTKRVVDILRGPGGNDVNNNDNGFTVANKLKWVRVYNQTKQGNAWNVLVHIKYQVSINQGKPRTLEQVFEITYDTKSHMIVKNENLALGAVNSLENP